MLGLVACQGPGERFGDLVMVVHLGRLLDNRLRMRGICPGVCDGLLLLAACLVLCGDLFAQLALARRGGSFCGLQLVARGICLSRYGLVRSFSVSDGGLCLLDGLLGGGE